MPRDRCARATAGPGGARYRLASSAGLVRRTWREGAPVTARNWYILAAAVVVVLVLAYACVPRGASPPAATTAPPATGTGTGTGTTQ
jgi:hypothetical protein